MSYGGLLDPLDHAMTAGFAMQPNVADELQDVPLAVEQASAAEPRDPEDSAFPQTEWNTRPDLRVSVSAPETVAIVSSLGLPISYTTYYVKTSTTLPSFPCGQMSVRRRYSDFEHLYAMLARPYAGYFIPKPPPKDFVKGRMLVDRHFVERRAEDLQVFLTRACSHMILHTSKAFELFVMLDTEELQSHPEWKQLESSDSIFLSFQHVTRSHEHAPDAAEPQSGRTQLLKFSDSVVSTFFRFSQQVREHIAPDPKRLTPQESKMQQLGMALNDSALHYGVVVTGWGRVTRCLEEHGFALAELGTMLNRLYKMQDAALSSLGVYTPIGCCVSREAQQFQRAAHVALDVGSNGGKLATMADRAALPLRHVESGMTSGHLAFKDREQLYAACNCVKEQLQEKQEKYRVHRPESAAGSPSRRSGSGEELTQLKQMQALEERRDRIENDYSSVLNSNQAEADTVLAEKARAAPVAVMQIACIQQRAAAYAEERWLQLAEELEKLLPSHAAYQGRQVK